MQSKQFEMNKALALKAVKDAAARQVQSYASCAVQCLKRYGDSQKIGVYRK